jgi:CHAT domain-containing protein
MSIRPLGRFMSAFGMVAFWTAACAAAGSSNTHGTPETQHLQRLIDTASREASSFTADSAQFDDIIDNIASMIAQHARDDDAQKSQLVHQLLKPDGEKLSVILRNSSVSGAARLASALYAVVDQNLPLGEDDLDLISNLLISPPADSDDLLKIARLLQKRIVSDQDLVLPPTPISPSGYEASLLRETAVLLFRADLYDEGVQTLDAIEKIRTRPDSTKIALLMIRIENARLKVWAAPSVEDIGHILEMSRDQVWRASLGDASANIPLDLQIDELAAGALLRGANLPIVADWLEHIYTLIPTQDPALLAIRKLHTEAVFFCGGTISSEKIDLAPSYKPSRDATWAVIQASARWLEAERAERGKDANLAVRLMSSVVSEVERLRVPKSSAIYPVFKELRRTATYVRWLHLAIEAKDRGIARKAAMGMLLQSVKDAVDDLNPLASRQIGQAGVIAALELKSAGWNMEAEWILAQTKQQLRQAGSSDEAMVPLIDVEMDIAATDSDKARMERLLIEASRLRHAANDVGTILNLDRDSYNDEDPIPFFVPANINQEDLYTTLPQQAARFLTAYADVASSLPGATTYGGFLSNKDTYAVQTKAWELMRRWVVTPNDSLMRLNIALARADLPNGAAIGNELRGLVAEAERWEALLRERQADGRLGAAPSSNPTLFLPRFYLENIKMADKPFCMTAETRLRRTLTADASEYRREIAAQSLRRYRSNISRIETSILARYRDHADKTEWTWAGSQDFWTAISGLVSHGLVIPFQFEGSIWIGTLDMSNGVRIYKTSTPPSHIMEEIEELRRSLESLGTIGFPGTTAYVLYEQLFGEALSNWNDSRLVVAMGEDLRRLPLNALVTKPWNPSAPIKDQAWLDQSFIVQNVPGLDTVGLDQPVARNEQLPASATSASPFGFVGIGAPALTPIDLGCIGGRSTVEASKHFRISDLCALPQAADLLVFLRRALTFGTNPQLLLTGEAANKKAFESSDVKFALATAPVIAFVTHALTPDQSVDFGGAHEAALVLSPLSQVSSNASSQLLYASEIASMSITADVVFLMACGSGERSEPSFTEGFRGLSDAFLAAGARALVLADWPIDDDSTAKFADILARGAGISKTRLVVKEDPALQLHVARGVFRIEESRRGEQFVHPAFWAGFESISPVGPLP